MAKNASAGAGGSRARAQKIGENGLTMEDVRPFFDEVHDLTDQMEEYSAGRRQQIGKVYDRMSEKLGLTKGAVMMAFKLERRERKDAAKAAKMDAGDRQALEKLSQAFGGSFGDYLKDLAGQEPAEETAEE